MNAPIGANTKYKTADVKATKNKFSVMFIFVSIINVLIANISDAIISVSIWFVILLVFFSFSIVFIGENSSCIILPPFFVLFGKVFIFCCFLVCL